LKHKKSKRWVTPKHSDIKLNVYLSITKEYGIDDPTDQWDWDEDRNTDGENLLIYRGFLKAILAKLKNDPKLTKKKREKLSIVKGEIMAANYLIRGRNLSNWYLHYG
jgi:hypothetical protein